MEFENVICFTDLHFGEKQNSRTHNEDCLEFLDWVIETAKERNIKECVFLGDWHHSRRSINVETLSYSMQGLKKINDYFDNIWFLEGNHDLYFRETREISSVSVVESFDNIHLIKSPTVLEFSEGNVALIPWLVEDEWKQLKNTQYKYVFGHFELPTFLLNAMMEKPDTGELNKEHFKNCSYVFSGHFHKRQNKKNVHYIGNAFPHNFNDVDDNDRGLMILEWDNAPEFINWPNCPSYRRWNIEDVKDDPENTIGDLKKIHAEIFYSDSMSYSQACSMRDDLYENNDFRNIILKKIKSDENHDGEEIEATTVTSVDSLVIEQLQTIDSEKYDTNMLVDEYNSLSSDGTNQ